MKTWCQLIIIIMFLIASAATADAQKTYKINHFTDSLLTKRYKNTDIDTNYIIRPQTKWTLVGRLNMTGAKLRCKGNDNGNHFETEMSADRKATLCLSVSYLGLSVWVALNPAKLLGKYSDFELNGRSYGKRFGFDISYQDAHNFNGWFQTEGEPKITLHEDVLRLRTLNASAYYIFNHKSFSYPAAFAHSYIQKRSAGSPMLALSAQGQRGETRDEKLTDESHRMRYKTTNIGIGGGYGYNYVPHKRWLLHISALPTLIVYSHSSLYIGEMERPVHYHFPEFIITGRGAIVKQIGDNKFAGFSIVGHTTSIGGEADTSIRSHKWMTRIYFGIRL